jgi:hypothetical protein
MPKKSYELKDIEKFWETQLKNKYGFSCSKVQLIQEICLKFGASPQTVSGYRRLLRDLGLIRQSRANKHIWDIAQKGIGVKE